MRAFILVIILSTLLVCIGKGKKIDSLYYKYTSTFPDSTQISIALINNGEIEYVGFTKTGGNLIPTVNKNTVFEIGSITKVFTSTLLAQLITDGTIGLNEPIEKILPFPLNSSDFDNGKITFETLSNHTSGLPEMPDNYLNNKEDNSDEKVYDSKILEDYLKNSLKLNREPGEEYLYSNLGYAILGYLIEKIKKSEYEKILQQVICKKYNLNSTTSEYERVKTTIIAGRNPEGYIIANKVLGVFKSSGGIMSNVVDLTRFMKANFDKSKLLEYQRQERYHWGNSGMALGWHIMDIGANCKWYYHIGRMDGYCSALFMDVPSKTGVVILSNLSAQHPDNDYIDKLASELMKREYLNNKNAQCRNGFIEVALTEGWGTHIQEKILTTDIAENSIVGVWIRINNKRVVTRTFTEDHKVQTDFYKDKEIDVWGYFKTNGNQIIFNDIGGEACNSDGIYEYQVIKDTLRFKVISDNCDGRKTDLLNEWTRMNRIK